MQRTIGRAPATSASSAVNRGPRVLSRPGPSLATRRPVDARSPCARRSGSRDLRDRGTATPSRRPSDRAGATLPACDAAARSSVPVVGRRACVGAVDSSPTYVTRYRPDCVLRPPMAKYIAPSFGLITKIGERQRRAGDELFERARVRRAVRRQVHGVELAVAPVADEERVLILRRETSRRSRR